MLNTLVKLCTRAALTYLCCYVCVDTFHFAQWSKYKSRKVMETNHKKRGEQTPTNGEFNDFVLLLLFWSNAYFNHNYFAFYQDTKSACAINCLCSKIISKMSHKDLGSIDFSHPNHDLFDQSVSEKFFLSTYLLLSAFSGYKSNSNDDNWIQLNG